MVKGCEDGGVGGMVIEGSLLIDILNIYIYIVYVYVYVYVCI